MINTSTVDGAPVQTWTCSGGANQQWQPVSEGGGYYHFVNRNSGKCLTSRPLPWRFGPAIQVTPVAGPFTRAREASAFYPPSA